MQPTLTDEAGHHSGMAARRQLWRRPIVWTGATVVVIAATLIQLASALPANGFYSGDCGVKLIAAKNAIEHHARPLQVDPPVIGGVSAARYMDPFFVPHGTHAHAVQSPLFPVLTAPLLALAGLRGVYIIPALAFLALIALLPLVPNGHWPRGARGAVLFVAVLANPLLFYSLEFWEHAPAAALLAVSTILVFARQHGRLVCVGAGFAGGIAALLRPEAAWYVIALTAVVAIEDRKWSSPLHLILGFAGAIAPLLVYNQVHFGGPAGPHLASNLGGLPDGWLARRIQLIGSWLVPPSSVARLAIAGMAAAWLWAACTARYRRAQILALVSAAVLATLAALGWLNRESLWQACPIAALAAVPVPPERARPWRLLAILAVVTSLGVLFTANNDGGAQWGPRYLLIASPAIMLLAGFNVATLLRGRRVLVIAFIAIVLLESAYVSRRAYADLRGAKRYYARIVVETDRQLSPGGYLLTDLWWFDQITAALHDRGAMLFAGDERTAKQALRELDAAGIQSVLVVRSRSESPAGTLQAWIAGTGYAIGGTTQQQERQLSYVMLERHPAKKS